MHKYEKLCWYCGGHDLESTESGVRCRGCGATFTHLPELHDSGFVVENDPSSPNYVPGRKSRRRPSGIHARQAARARGDAR